MENTEQLKAFCKSYGIGLTGGVATGKSTVANILRAQYCVIDADHLSRLVVTPGEPAFQSIVARFGKTILQSNGELNRASLRHLITHSLEHRTQLESIVHPALLQALHAELVKEGLFQKPQFWFYEAALLFEKQRTDDFRDIWVTSCPHSIQLERLQKRDTLSTEEAQALISTQWPQEDKCKLANVVIQTHCSLSQLQEAVFATVQSRLPHHPVKP